MGAKRRFSARLWVGALIALAIAAGAYAILVSGSSHELQPRAAGERPRLMLLTSLPLIFPEQFTLEGGGSKALEALERRYTVVPIATTDARSLKQARLLLMAHPLAQPAENLVDLDSWIRRGGHVLLLADPRLEWPSSRPLGDKLRPPPAFADTGLLAHWGLRLEAPDDPGPVALGGGHHPVIYLSPGRLVSTNPDCGLSRADIIAECAIGKGKIAVIADADFLNADAVSSYGGRPENQTAELLELLESLERD